MTVVAITRACTACGACLPTCPERCLRPVPPDEADGVPLLVLTDACTGCLECLEVCPADAVTVVRGD